MEHILSDSAAAAGKKGTWPLLSALPIIRLSRGKKNLLFERGGYLPSGENNL
jgi:hypothetical protein